MRELLGSVLRICLQTTITIAGTYLIALIQSLNLPGFVGQLIRYSAFIFRIKPEYWHLEYTSV